MEATQLDSLNQFINVLPPEDFDNLSEIGKARVFIWFGQEVLKTPLTGEEIEACYVKVGLNVPKNSIESRIRQDRSIQKLPENKYAIKRDSKREFDVQYGKFIGLPKIDALKIRPPLLPQDEDNANRMAKSYLFLYLIENSARKWIMDQMSKELGQNWWQTVKDDPTNVKWSFETTKIRVEKIKRDEEKTKLKNQTVHNLYYCEFGDLIELMFYIKQRGKNSIPPVIMNKRINCLKEVAELRNLIAHCRGLTSANETKFEQLFINWCELISD
jgi:hypothetical protein